MHKSRWSVVFRQYIIYIISLSVPSLMNRLIRILIPLYPNIQIYTNYVCLLTIYKAPDPIYSSAAGDV